MNLLSSFIMIFNSNARYIDFRKLWTLRTSEVVRCGTFNDVWKYWNTNKKQYTKLKYLFISVGTNDLVYKTPHQLFQTVHNFVVKLKDSVPGIKIILSEVLPRMDDVDKKVKEVNQLLQQYVQGKPELFLTRHSNLRDPDFFMSDKYHLNHAITPRFASNIKRALRAAHGMEEINKDRYTKLSTPSPRRNPVPQQHTQQHTQYSNILHQLLFRIAQAFQYPGT